MDLSSLETLAYRNDLSGKKLQHRPTENKFVAVDKKPFELG